MKIVGITGGIASGKSTVSSYLQDKYKAYVFDADKEAKVLLQSKSVKDKIHKAFPNLKDLSTVSIAQEVFKNSESQERINNIIHPIIGDLILERIKNISHQANLDQLMSDNKKFLLDLAQKNSDKATEIKKAYENRKQQLKGG